MRKCPNCTKTISFWAFIKSGLFDPSHKGEIVCKSCNHIVSTFWSDALAYLGIFEVVLAVVVWKFSSPLTAMIVLFLLITVVLIIFLYFIVPFKSHGIRK